jgi:hypothetical protein
MAKLNKDKTIEFATRGEFFGHYDSHIAKGGFYLDADADWELRQVHGFTIVVVGEPHRAEFQAEVVFSGGGKVGLQLSPDPANAKAISKLLKNLRADAEGFTGASKGPRATPRLKDDGTILYQSAPDFLADYEANITSGAIYAESARPWPKDSTFAFLISVHDQEGIDLPVHAKVVFADGGIIGLMLVIDEGTREALADLVEILKEEEEELDEAPEAVQPGATATGVSPEQPDPAPSKQPVSRGLVYASKDADEFVPVELFDIRPDVKPQTTLFGLLASIVSTRKALRLELVNNDVTLVFHFKSDGSLVDYTAPNSEADLLNRLVKAAFWDKGSADALKAELTPAKTVVQELTERKAVNRQQLMIALGEQAVDALERVRAAGEVPFRVFEEKDEWEAGASFGSMITPWLERAIKALPAETIKALLKPMWKKALKVRTDKRWPVESCNLDNAGHQFVRKLRGSKPLPAVVAGFEKRQRDKLFRLAIALRVVRSVDLVKPAAQDNKKKNELEDLAKELGKLRKADKFAQSGVHWSAHKDMYGPAMLELQRKYGRSSPLSKVTQKASRMCQDRVMMAKMANEYLSDDYQRQEYRKEVVKEGLLLESAQLLFRKAQMAISEDNPRASIELLEMACELDPEKPEYRAKLQKVFQHLKKKDQ